MKRFFCFVLCVFVATPAIAAIPGDIPGTPNFSCDASWCGGGTPHSDGGIGGAVGEGGGNAPEGGGDCEGGGEGEGEGGGPDAN